MVRPISAEASRGYSHLTSGTSNGSFTPLLHSRSSRHTRLHWRGSTRVPPISRGAPLSPPSSRGGILSLRVRERIPGIPVASQEEALSTGKARGTPGSSPIPRVPKMTLSIPGKPVFLALPRLSSRGSTHTTVARGTALWESLMESLVGNPRGKATDPLIHAKKSVTLLLHLGRKAHVHAPTRDKD